jgi:hypothetical protein
MKAEAIVYRPLTRPKSNWATDQVSNFVEGLFESGMHNLCLQVFQDKIHCRKNIIQYIFMIKYVAT